MKIKILQIGKTKDSYLEDGIAEYLKRLQAFADMEVLTLRECSPSKTKTIERCVSEEGNAILKHLDGEDCFKVLLDVKGKEVSSEQFADFLKKHKDVGRSIAFVIGGAFGLSEEVKNKADLLISFSKMTFTHQMIRLILLEQIYRGLCIVEGKRYHIA